MHPHQTHQQEIVSRGTLYRDDIVYTSYQTLFLLCKDSNTRLCDRLISQGVFTQSQLDTVTGQVP